MPQRLSMTRDEVHLCQIDPAGKHRVREEPTQLEVEITNLLECRTRSPTAQLEDPFSEMRRDGVFAV